MAGRRGSEFRLRLVASEVERASEQFRQFGTLSQESMERLRRSLQPVNDNLRRTDAAVSGFRDNLRGVASNIAVLDGPLGGIASRFNALATSIGRVGIVMGTFLLALAAGGFALAKLTRDSSSFEREMERLGNVLRATGGAAVVTVDQVNQAATTLARDTLTSITEAREAAASVVASPNIGGIEDVERILALAQDLSEVFGGNLRNNAQLLARAFNQPSEAFDLLERRSVNLSETLKENIRDLENSGQRARAAAVLFEELSRRVGGAGEIGGLPGAIDLAGVEFERLIDLAGEFFNINEVGSAIFNTIADGVRSIGDAIESEVRPTVADLNDDLDGINEQLAAIRAARQLYSRAFAGDGPLASGFRSSEEGLQGTARETRQAIVSQQAERASRERAAQFRLLGQEADELAERERRLSDALESVNEAFEDQSARRLARIIEQAGGEAALGSEGLADVTARFQALEARRETGKILEQLGREEEQAAQKALDAQLKLTEDYFKRRGEVIRKGAQEAADDEQEIVERNNREIQRLLERLDPLERYRRLDALLQERQERALEPEAAEQTQRARDLLLQDLQLPEPLADLESAAVQSFDTIGTAALDMASDIENASDIAQNALSGLLRSFADTLLQVGVISPLAGALAAGIRGSFQQEGSFLNTFFAGGFQHGGDFVVPGAGGPDSVLTTMLTTPGEKVTVTPQGLGGGATLGGEATLRVLLEQVGGGRGVSPEFAPFMNAIADRAAATAQRRILDGASGRNRTMMRIFGGGRR